MNKETKVEFAKIAIRVCTFVIVSNVVVFTFGQVLPYKDMAKIGKVALFISKAVVAEMIAYQSTKFVDDMMDGTFARTVIFGKESNL